MRHCRRFVAFAYLTPCLDQAPIPHIDPCVIGFETGLKWCLQSMRTGSPFAQIALLHGLVYRVEQVFLIHRETGLLLCHRETEDIQKKSPDLVSSMLTAINDFVGDSFALEAERTLDSIEIGELSIWVEPGPDLILALAIRGEAPASLRGAMQETLEDIQHGHADALQAFAGDTAYFEARPELLDPCVQAQYQPRGKGISARSLIVVLALLGLLAWWVGGKIHQAGLEEAYIAQLRAQPGYAITEAVSEGDRLLISGLRDPLAADPSETTLPPGLETMEVVFDLRPYQSLEAVFVERRAHQILQPPDGVEMTLSGNQLLLSGVSDRQWRDQMLFSLPLIAGIDSADTSGLRLRFDLAMLQAPASVSASLEDGLLYLEGAADQDWIDTLDDVISRYPEITSIDSRALVNLTELQLVKDIAALEREIILFDVATSFDFDSFDENRITSLVHKIIAAAGKLSRNVLINVKGYSDSVGNFEDNAFLSQERAEFVAQAIINTGVNPRYLSIRGLESPMRAERSEEERRLNRRVEFDVSVE